MLKFIILSLLLISSAFASLPEGKFEGMARRGQGCYYQFNGSKLVFGYMPDDRPWGVCVVKAQDMIELNGVVMASGSDCSAKFNLEKNSAVMVFREAGAPYKTVTCRDLR